MTCCYVQYGPCARRCVPRRRSCGGLVAGPPPHFSRSSCRIRTPNSRNVPRGPTQRQKTTTRYLTHAASSPRIQTSTPNGLNAIANGDPGCTRTVSGSTSVTMSMTPRGSAVGSSASVTIAGQPIDGSWSARPSSGVSLYAPARQRRSIAWDTSGSGPARRLASGASPRGHSPKSWRSPQERASTASFSSARRTMSRRSEPSPDEGAPFWARRRLLSARLCDTRSRPRRRHDRPY